MNTRTVQQEQITQISSTIMIVIILTVYFHISRRQEVMRVDPSLPGIPLKYSHFYQLPPTPIETTTRVLLGPQTSDIDNNYPKDLIPVNFLEHLYNHFYPKLIAPTEYIIHHVDEGLKYKHNKIMSLLSPFFCEKSKSVEDYMDYNDYIDSTEMLAKRKYSKYHMKKSKKNKSKKKKTFFKFLIGLFIFIALKILFLKFHYFFPTIFPTTGREEALTGDEVDVILLEGSHKEKTSNRLKAQQLEEKYRTLFAPNFDETRIAAKFPLQRSSVRRVN